MFYYALAGLAVWLPFWGIRFPRIKDSLFLGGLRALTSAREAVLLSSSE